MLLRSHKPCNFNNTGALDYGETVYLLLVYFLSYF